MLIFSRYAEAIISLHRQNIVHLDQVHILPFLSRGLATGHLLSIRRMTVSPFRHCLDRLTRPQFEVPKGSRIRTAAKSCWRLTCEILAKLTNLQDLTVYLPRRDITDWTVAEYLLPLEAIRTPKFKVLMCEMQYQAISRAPEFLDSSFNRFDSVIQTSKVEGFWDGNVPESLVVPMNF